MIDAVASSRIAHAAQAPALHATVAPLFFGTICTSDADFWH